ncbi:tripartite tricarboxylate transporter substrate-binding protein [Cupriavidus basilensis]
MAEQARPADSRGESPSASHNHRNPCRREGPPDGYTILLRRPLISENPIHFKKVAYDPLKDFTPLGRIGLSATVVVDFDPDLGVKNVDEFVKAARGKRWSYGAGSSRTAGDFGEFSIRRMVWE